MTEPNTTRSNRRLLLKLVIIVVGMFGFGFAMVPLYDMFCEVTGINGKTSGDVAEVNAAGVDESRTITVQFLATNNEQLPWIFKPNQFSLKMHPGEMKRTSYYAKNLTDKTMVVQAIPSVSPGLAAKYLRKTECFCFTQQSLKGGEEMDMPLLFHVDPDLPEDIQTITLSYTMFDAANYEPRTETGKISS